MFNVYFNNRKVKNASFKTYEQARSFARIRIRNMLSKGTMIPNLMDASWRRYDNPSINEYGFNIKKA